MGLDMFLEKHTFISKYSPHKLELSYPNIKPERVTYVHEEVGYWRKANAIHQWFVDSVQGGIDECQTTYIEPDQLAELSRIAKRIIWNHELAPELLPTQSGFFFGGTEYDEYYFQGIANTIEIVDSILTEEGTRDLYYHASW